MDPGSKVSNSAGIWPCNVIGISALNISGFSKGLLIPATKPSSQNQLSGSDIRRGSVPSTPESDCEEIDKYASSNPALDMDTRDIIDAFLKQFTGHSHSKCVKKQVVSTMKRVVDSLVLKHGIAYNGTLFSVLCSRWHKVAVFVFAFSLVNVV